MEARLCDECEVPLVSGKNWTEGAERNKLYLCRTCLALRGRLWRKAHPKTAYADETWFSLHIQRRRASCREKKIADRNSHLSQVLERNYGITLAEYNEMLDDQGGGCFICGRTAAEEGKRLGVDHDHDTGEVRGLLCQNCNTAIGFLQDDPALLRSAADYLDSLSPTPYAVCNNVKENLWPKSPSQQS